jgi:hypothetical protein
VLSAFQGGPPSRAKREDKACCRHEACQNPGTPGFVSGLASCNERIIDPLLPFLLGKTGALSDELRVRTRPRHQAAGTAALLVATSFQEAAPMARKYSQGASKSVKRALTRRKRGTLKSGRSGKKVKSRKQAIAIGLSEARKKGEKVPQRKRR